MGDRKYSTFLFPEPSGLYGVARLFDLTAQLDSYNTSVTEAVADAIAMYCDWSAVGQDLRNAMKMSIERGEKRAA